MKTIIHVNQHKIKSNHKTGEREPVLTVKTYKSNNYAHNVVIRDKEGNEVARVVYSPDKPLACGARVWVETQHDVDLDSLMCPDGWTPGIAAEHERLHGVY